jgi:hypothetical protein
MGTKGGVSRNRSVNLVRTQVRYREWGRRRGLRAYNRPEITPPGGKESPNRQPLLSGRDGNASQSRPAARSGEEGGNITGW